MTAVAEACDLPKDAMSAELETDAAASVFRMLDPRVRSGGSQSFLPATSITLGHAVTLQKDGRTLGGLFIRDVRGGRSMTASRGGRGGERGSGGGGRGESGTFSLSAGVSA